MQPVVGITTYAERASFGSWNEECAFIPLSYVRSVEHAGGRVLLVPPAADGIVEILDALDGLVLSGGGDVDPALYGAERHPETRGISADRDRAEVMLLEAALARDLPVLAVCRGSQILNVARGGDLVQHLPEVVGHEGHRETPGVFADHSVRLRRDSRLGETFGGEHAPVKSHHHQGMGAIGEGLVEVAWAEDGTVEGLEDPTRRFALGVLWHPEEGEDLALFRALVEEASAYRAERLARTPA
jgi:gamma-glutamyl-gamma-aminobutyrate hydrolase PuuD